jgi:hypothetical protein
LFGWFAEPPPGPAPSATTAVAFPFEIALEVARLETLQRSILCGPVESWRLDPVRLGYEAVMRRTSDAEALRILHSRLDAIAGQAEIARSARTIRALLDRSRRRDAEVARVKRSLAALDQTKARTFAARGRLQPSSRQVDGRRVYALIGREGAPIAYLDMPPGLDARGLTAKRVGVHGHVRYNESLGNRLIAVRDLEPLE